MFPADPGIAAGANMYLASIVLLMLVLPAARVIVEALWFGTAADVMPLVASGFVFWAVGVRLFIAGVRQVAQPQFTAESIFEIKDRAAFAIVRAAGFANLSTGTLGLANLAVPACGRTCRHCRRPLLRPCRSGTRVSRQEEFQ